MPIFVCGLNHKTAGIALREQVVFAKDKLAVYLEDLVRDATILEAVILSTCNRSELYAVAPTAEVLVDWFCRQHRVDADTLKAAIYCYQDHDAVHHMMNVACGLDSMVLGETQILGQMKEAYAESGAAGTIQTVFNRLFQHIFALAKEVHTHTSLGACPVSIASAAVGFLKSVVPKPLEQMTLLLVGAGTTAELVLRHVRSIRPERVLIVNRHPQHALRLAELHQAEVRSFAALADAIFEADIVITATGASQPIIDATCIAPRTKPLYMVDIAVPRDVAPEVASNPKVTLYSIDDLRSVIEAQHRGREHAALKARERVEQHSHDFMTWLRSFSEVATTIRLYRQQIEQLCHQELAKAFRQLNRGDDPAQVLAAFAHGFTNKMLHHPSVQLRQAGSKGRFELLALAKELFALSDSAAEEAELTS